MMRQLHGLNCLLTGGSRGIGPHIARALAQEGVNLALVARTAHLLEEVASSLEASAPIRAIPVQADLTDPQARIGAVERATEELGVIHLLVNNAAGIQWTRFHRQPQRIIQQLVDLNLVAPLHLAQLVLPPMINRGQGGVITIASLSGRKGIPYEATYSATKAGLIQWSTALRMELRGTGVRVSVILPSAVKDEGLFAVHGFRASRLSGPVRARSVARAVVRAAYSSPSEIIVRRGPTRPLLVVEAMSPTAGDIVIRSMKLDALHERLAYETRAGEAMAQEDQEGPDLLGN